MDGHDCDGNKKRDAIKEKISSGEWSNDDLGRSLNAAINAELEKPFDEINQEYVNVCRTLLTELTGSDKYESKQPQYEQKLLEKLNEKPRQRVICKKFYVAMASALALIVFLAVGQGVLSHRWLEGHSTEDAEQFVIKGYVDDPALIESGTAESDSNREIWDVETQDFDEAVAVLGFTPKMPTWYPEGWIRIHYYAAQSASMDWFYEGFTSEKHRNVLRYDVRRYSDLSTATNAFEQSEFGTYVECNGWDVYLSMNIDDPIAIWLDGTTCYSIAAPISKDEMLKMIESIPR